MNDNLSKEDREVITMLIADVYKEILLEEEIEDIDREIKKENITVPTELTEALEKRYGLNLFSLYEKFKFKGRKIIAWLKGSQLRIAVCILLVAIILTRYPHYAPAFKNLLRGVSFEDTGESVYISVNDFTNPDFNITIPESFKGIGGYFADSFKRYDYESENNFLQISIYSETFQISLDNENADTIKDLSINGQNGKMYVKNGITTIVFSFDGKLIQLKSDLPEEEVEAIAKSINM